MPDALPDRYVVERRGTPDPPTAAYYVLDHAHDFHARVVLAALVRYYRQHGQMVAADELERALAASKGTFKAMIEAQTAARAGAKKKTSRSKKQDFTPA